MLVLPNGSQIPGLYSGQAGHTHGSQKGGSGDPMAPAEECLRYPSILGLRQLLQEENGDGQNQPAQQVPPQRAREVKGTNYAGPSIEKPEGEGVVFQTARIERTQKHKHKQTAKGPPFVWTDTVEKAFG